MSRGSPYFSAPALLISAGVHVLVLVVLMCFGGGSSVSDDKSPDASVPVEKAEEKEGEAPSSSVEAKEEKEVQQAREAALQVCTLGKRILRCETAPLCALSAVMYDAGEF